MSSNSGYGCRSGRGTSRGPPSDPRGLREAAPSPSQCGAPVVRRSIDYPDFAFDSQNVAFWSEAEACYVCLFRTWKCSHGQLRAIHKTTSPDFVDWTEPVATDANLPGEHLYTSQTHPYFRAPHLYVALPTRFQPERGDSTDILFMAMRAGSDRYERLFAEAFIRPGLDPASWGNRSNYAARGVVPTGPAEMSLYHCNGLRYTLRTDGFISLRAGYAAGTMIDRERPEHCSHGTPLDM